MLKRSGGAHNAGRLAVKLVRLQHVATYCATFHTSRSIRLQNFVPRRGGSNRAKC